MKKLLFSLILVCIIVPNVFASDDKKPSQPASNVVVENSTSGILALSSSFVGSVKFADTSSVAAESTGKIKSANFEEGDLINKGSVLAVIDSELLEKSLAEAEASLEQIDANLQLAKNDYERTAKLYKGNATSEQSYDNKKYAALALEKQKSAQYAVIANLKAQLEKKIVYAPYNGIVVSKKASLGEWVNAGSVVAEFAKTGIMDIIVNVPERLLTYMKKGLVAEAEIAGQTVKASFQAIIPAGDVTNRTFPVKFRTNSSTNLLEGMEAKISLPTANTVNVIFINRDAIVKAQGNIFVYTVIDNAAKPLPVNIVGYEGSKAGVTSQALKAGMPVVVKGNERLRPDQPVNIIGN